MNYVARCPGCGAVVARLENVAPLDYARAAETISAWHRAGFNVTSNDSGGQVVGCRCPYRVTDTVEATED